MTEAQIHAFELNLCYVFYTHMLTSMSEVQCSNTRLPIR